MTHSILVAVISALAAMHSANAQNAVASGGFTTTTPTTHVAMEEVAVKVQVLEVNLAHRTAKLRGPRGQTMVVDVPSEVKNFAQVRAGDVLTVHMTAMVMARLEPAPKDGIRERVESGTVVGAAPGFLPGMAGRNTVEFLATIQAVDRKARMVTLRGASRTIMLPVPDDMDIAQVKVGGAVRATLIEAAVVSMEPAPASK